MIQKNKPTVMSQKQFHVTKVCIYVCCVYVFMYEVYNVILCTPLLAEVSLTSQDPTTSERTGGLTSEDPSSSAGRPSNNINPPLSEDSEVI